MVLGRDLPYHLNGLPDETHLNARQTQTLAKLHSQSLAESSILKSLKEQLWILTMLDVGFQYCGEGIRN